MKKRLMVLLILALSLTVAGGALAAKFPGATVGFQWGSDRTCIPSSPSS